MTTEKKNPRKLKKVLENRNSKQGKIKWKKKCNYYHLFLFSWDSLRNINKTMII